MPEEAEVSEVAITRRRSHNIDRRSCSSACRDGSSASATRPCCCSRCSCRESRMTRDGADGVLLRSVHVQLPERSGIDPRDSGRNAMALRCSRSASANFLFPRAHSRGVWPPAPAPAGPRPAGRSASAVEQLPVLPIDRCGGSVRESSPPCRTFWSRLREYRLAGLEMALPNAHANPASQAEARILI